MTDGSKAGTFSYDMSEFQGLWEMTHPRSDRGRMEGLEEVGDGGHWAGADPGMGVSAARHPERGGHLG